MIRGESHFSPRMKHNWRPTIFRHCWLVRSGLCNVLPYWQDTWGSLLYIRHLLEYLDRVAEVDMAGGEVMLVSISVSGASRLSQRPRLLRINLSSFTITMMLLIANIALNIDRAASTSAEFCPIKLRLLLVFSSPTMDKLTTNMMQAMAIFWVLDRLKIIVTRWMLRGSYSTE